MRITLAAVGRHKAGPSRDLYEEYIKRLTWPITLREVEERRSLPAPALKQREGALLLAAVPKAAQLVALDEHGKVMSSTEFAQLLGNWQDQSVQDVAFVIGGADGLDHAVTSAAARTLSFGRMTWPHMLVRVLLAEQLFRAQSILTGHPYHRD